MEIHKPKPVHSWRELLSEVGVVVIGIVIALSGEQAVEAVHHAEQRKELRQALDRDSRQAIADSKSTIDYLDRIIALEKTKIDQLRAARADPRILGAQLPVEQSAFDPPTEPAFQAASTSGRLSLLTPDEIAAYSEAHIETQYAETALQKFEDSGEPIAIWNFKFQQPGGPIDLSKADSVELNRYFDLLASHIYYAYKYRQSLLFLWGAREALLRGDRDLPALYRAERDRSGFSEKVSH